MSEEYDKSFDRAADPPGDWQSGIPDGLKGVGSAADWVGRHAVEGPGAGPVGAWDDGIEFEEPTTEDAVAEPGEPARQFPAEAKHEDEAHSLDGPEAVREERPLTTLDMLIDEETHAIAEAIRARGTLDRAFEAAEETAKDHLAGEASISEPGECGVRLYREVEFSVDPQTGPEEVETSGGVQVNFELFDAQGAYSHGVRVPVYRISSEGMVRPAGGVFEDIDEARMVAAQVTDLRQFAKDWGIMLHPDLTIVGREDREPALLERLRPDEF